MIYSNVAPVMNQQYRVFPVAHSWANPFIVTYEYKTDLIRSGNGKEQRRAVRWFPRRTMEFSITYMDDQKFALDKFLDQAPDRLTWFPEENSVTFMTSEMGEDQQSVFVKDANKGWMEPGVTVLLQYKGRAETRVISDAGGQVMQFTEFNKTVWPRGTKITAAVLCRLTSPESQRLTNRAGTAKISAQVEPGMADYTPSVFGQEFLGFREYFHWKQNWGVAPTVTHEYPRDDIDYGFGRVSAFVSEKFPQRTYKANFWRAGTPQVRQLLDFFGRHRGMWKEFFMSSFEKQIPYVATAGLTKSIFVEGLDFADTYMGSTVYRRVMIKRKDGTEIHRQIDFIEALPETNTSVIWVTEDLPDEPLAPNDTLGLFWVTVARLASDRLDVAWLTNEVAQFSLPFRNLENFDI